MKDFNLRHMLYVLPVALAIAAAVFIAQAGTVEGHKQPAPQPVDMNVPF